MVDTESIDVSADRVVAIAREWLGTPYQHQACLKNVGCDCLGLVRGVWQELYGTAAPVPPPYRPDWAESTGEDALTEAARLWLREVSPVDLTALSPHIGQLVLFRWRSHLPAKHCAILTNPSSMIHAHDGACVAEVPLTRWWRRHISSVWAFPEQMISA
jgi:NlpC/P60 family putative phage cell wall peptidase